MKTIKRLTRPLVLTLFVTSALAVSPGTMAYQNISAVSSGLSLLPVAVSVVAPLAILSVGALITVVSVQASATGVVWVLERASDGSQASVRLAGDSAVAVGTVLACVVIGSGTILSAAGQAVAFVPNALGESLLYSELLTP